jgi:hypothetical protein
MYLGYLRTWRTPGSEHRWEGKYSTPSAVMLARNVKLPAPKRTSLENSHWFVDFSVAKQRLASSSKEASAAKELLGTFHSRVSSLSGSW